MADKTGFFEESPGNKSFMRLESFLVLIFFFLINGVLLLVHIKALAKSCELPPISDNFLWLDSILLTFGFFPKVAQKLIEEKFGVKDSSPPPVKTE